MALPKGSNSRTIALFIIFFMGTRLKTMKLPVEAMRFPRVRFHAENMGNFIQERNELEQKREATVEPTAAEYHNVQSFLCS